MAGKISELGAASALAGAELVELVQGGVSVKGTAQDIANLFLLFAGALTQSVTSVQLTSAAGIDLIAAAAGNDVISLIAGGSGDDLTWNGTVLLADNGIQIQGKGAAPGDGGNLKLSNALFRTDITFDPDPACFIELNNGDVAAQGYTVNLYELVKNSGISIDNGIVRMDASTANCLLQFDSAEPPIWNLVTLGSTPVLVSALPATPTAGDRAFVTDATVTMTLGIGTVVAGTGSNGVPVYYDGSDWRIG